MDTFSTGNKNNLIKFDKPFLCSYEGYEPIPIKDMMEVVDEKLHIVNSRLAYCDHISRNRCFYGLDDILWSLKNSKYVQECIAQGIWKGEYQHPDRKCSLDRFMKIDDTRVSHVIKKYWTEGDFLKGLVQFIPPKGDIIWRWITEAAMNMAFSLRIYTPNFVKKTDANGVPYVQKTKPMYPVTFDAVDTPGYENIRLVDPQEFASKNPYFLSNGKNDSIGIESYCFDWIEDDVSKKLKDVLYSTSEEELNIVGDLFDMDMKKARAVLSDNGQQVTFSAEDGRDVTMHINAFTFNQVMNAAYPKN